MEPWTHRRTGRERDEQRVSVEHTDRWAHEKQPERKLETQTESKRKNHTQRRKRAELKRTS